MLSNTALLITQALLIFLPLQGGALNLIPHPQHLLAVPGLPYLKRTKPPHSR